MPLLVAPIFNSHTAEPLSLELGGNYRLVSGNEELFQLVSRYLRNEMNENRYSFDKKVTVNSLFLLADYPYMKVTEDRAFIEEIENKLNLASEDGVCSIPYVVTARPTAYGITYLKRSLEGKPLHLSVRTREIFAGLMQQNRSFPTLAYRRFLLSLEKENPEDQLLDLWIALESLFVPDGKKGEISYKLRLRMAYYFAAEAQLRQRFSQFIKTSYNHRSEIVHSGKVFGAELKEEVRLLRQMARAALLNMHMEGIAIQEVRLRLDELILSGQSYRERYAPDFFETVLLE
jgi:hypothetical protein